MNEPELRRRWTRILPAVFITYSLAYLDRANYGFGAAAGLATTLHITGQQSALLASLFFLGYLLPQIPGATYANRRSARRLIFIALLSWGAFAALTGVIRNFWLLAIDRMLLGVAESVVLPAMLILLMRWFTRSERSRANTFLILGNPVTVLWMSAATGFLIRAIGWQHTFVIEGALSVLWAFVWLVVIRDGPQQASWLSQPARTALELELEQEQQSLPQVVNIGRALRYPNVPRLCIQFFFWSVGVYGFVLWLPTIVRHGAALSMSSTGLLAAVPYILGIAGELGIGYLADRTGRVYTLIWPFLLFAGLAMFGTFTFADRSFPIAFTCLVLACGAMYAPYPPFFSIIPDRVPREWTGEVFALVNSAGALGGFAGSYLVGALRAITRNDRTGDLLMSLSFVVSAVLTIAIARMPVNSATLEARHA